MNSMHQRQHVSVRIDIVAYQYAKTKPNVSKYVENLIIQDMQVKQKEPIYTAIVERLLNDETVLPQLAVKLNYYANKPTVTQVDDNIKLVSGDWGA